MSGEREDSSCAPKFLGLCVRAVSVSGARGERRRKKESRGEMRVGERGKKRVERRQRWRERIGERREWRENRGDSG